MRSVSAIAFLIATGAALGCADRDELAFGAASRFHAVGALRADDGAENDFFGYAVAVSGSTAVVGAPRHEIDSEPERGAAYLFVKTAEAWQWQATLAAADGASGDHFGVSVAIAGATVLVGAPEHEVADRPFQGAAYVFVRDGDTWSQQGGALSADDGVAADAFGTAVGLSEADDGGANAVVGAPHHAVEGHSDQGAAYAFARKRGEWSQRGAALVAENGLAGEVFGSAVAVSGSTALVGAPVHQVGANPYQGGVYVFFDDGTAWKQQGSELTASDGGPFDQLSACALSGDRALLGAPLHVVGGHALRGAAYLFSRDGSTWREDQRLSAPDGETGDQFGSAVALSPTTALVSAPGRKAPAVGPSGGVYAFSPAAQQWQQQGSVWTGTEGAPQELFGPAVAVSEDSAFVGSPYRRVADSAAQGTVYSFAGSLLDR